MRIAMVSVHASPLVARTGPVGNGQAVQVDELSASLARAGHQVTVYARRTDPGQPDHVQVDRNYRVVLVPAGPARPLSTSDLCGCLGQFATSLRDAWQTRPPDLAHAHYWTSGLAAMLAARPTDLPVVQTFHALGAVTRQHQGDRDASPAERIRLERMVGRDAAAVVAGSADEVFALARIGVPRARITLVPSGVDSDAFVDTGPVAPRTDRVRLLAVGRLVPGRGFDAVITALSSLPDAELLIAGGPVGANLDIDPEAARLRRVADACGVADRVRLLGAIARRDLPALLRSADVLVCTPHYEPSGMVAVEAMACGLPVVATPVGGLTDAVVDGVTGLHVPPDQPRALRRALCRLLDESGLREAFGTAGRDRARSRYAWPSVTAELLRVYDQVLAKQSEPAGSPRRAPHHATRLAR